MNYHEINTAIAEGRDIDTLLVKKNKRFYDYLLNNKVAYYYASELSTHPNATEQAIIKQGDAFNAAYIKTVAYVKAVCEEENIPFLLFKTHRYIPAAVDGDIDLLVKRDDFQRFLQAFRDRDFDAIEDEPEKGKCTKEGYISIEPHVNISWRDNVFFAGDKAWEDATEVVYGDVSIPCCSPLVELLAAAGELYFSPEYIDLFRLETAQVLLSQQDSFDDVTDDTARKLLDQYVRWLDNVTSLYLDQKLPFFLPHTKLDKAIRAHVSGKERMEIVFKNFCWEYRYKLIDRLPFTHDWNI